MKLNFTLHSIYRNIVTKRTITVIFKEIGKTKRTPSSTRFNMYRRQNTNQIVNTLRTYRILMSNDHNLACTSENAKKLNIAQMLNRIKDHNVYNRLKFSHHSQSRRHSNHNWLSSKKKICMRIHQFGKSHARTITCQSCVKLISFLRPSEK